MNIVKFDNEKKYIKDFILLAETLYSGNDNMEAPSDIKKFVTGTHTLSKYFTLDKFLIYDNNKPVGRFAITVYPDDDTAYIGFYECFDDDNTAKFLFEEAEGIVEALTPVPGGVGAVTTSILAEHVAKAAMLSISQH